MKNLGIVFIFLSIIFFISSFFILNPSFTGYSIDSSNIEINFNKKEFLKYETIQIEIIGDIKQIISSQDIVIKRDNLIMPVNFYVEKINNNFYFAYATLNLDKGDYSIEIKIKTAKGVEVYKEKIKIKESNNIYYISLLNFVKGRLKYLSNKEIIYVFQALSEIDENLKEEAINEIEKRNLNDYEKALFLAVIKSDEAKLNILKSKIINYFLSIQDNNLGDYKVNIKTNINLSCKIYGIDYAISNENNISIENKFNSSLNLSFYCFKILDGNITNISENDLNLVNASLVKEYLGNKKIYNLNKKIENNSILFNIEKEFGSINNDTKLTSLVLIGFYENNISNFIYSFEWLKKNKKGIMENIALAILNESDAINYLIAIQNIDGSFNKEENFSKAEITCFAYKSEIPTKAIIYDWVKKNINEMNINDKSICLNFVLKFDDIISILPGIIKTESGKDFDIYLKNYGIKEINVTLTNILLDLNYTTTLEKDKLKKITITTPSINYDKPYLYDKISLVYGEKSFIVPIVIFIKQSQVKETKINESESKEIIINQTQNETNETFSFLNIFYIEPDKISLTINKSTKLKLKIKNIVNETINDIIISYSASLYDIIDSIEPSMINSLQPNKEKEIEINFDINKAIFQTYSGKINIEGKIKEQKYYAEVNVEINISKVDSLKNCNELNGNLCKTNEKCEGRIVSSLQGQCCLGKCVSQKGYGKVLGILFLIFGILFLILGILFFLRKKPKKEKKIEEAIKRIQEKEKLKFK
ncbi:MAG: hypothetical protein QXM27_02460 [Candidatus Pacearchaeota archaeon]